MAYTTIDDPTIYFNTLLYTGNGSSSHAITGVGFQPDWVWIKNRTATASGSHILNDAVRGTQKAIYTNDTGAEYGTSDALSAFGSDGFTVGNGAIINYNNDAYVAWNWLGANGTASNSNGSITSTVSANTTAGFSIVKYTGTGSNATVGHGLGAAPSMIIFKNTNSTRDWAVYHSAMNDPDAYLALNQTYAKEASYNFSNNTAPTSSVFSVGTLNGNNGSSQEYIAYCFAEKKGYSKFGSYTGNGNADGTFVYTGFLPAWVMIKRTDTTSDWNIMDNKRAVSFNPNTKELYSNSSQSEATGGQTIRDYLSNGFKLRGTSGGTNASGGTYIYMAFAESPFTNSNGVPTNAR